MIRIINKINLFIDQEKKEKGNVQLKIWKRKA